MSRNDVTFGEKEPFWGAYVPEWGCFWGGNAFLWWGWEGLSRIWVTFGEKEPFWGEFVPDLGRFRGGNAFLSGWLAHLPAAPPNNKCFVWQQFLPMQGGVREIFF